MADHIEETLKIVSAAWFIGPTDGYIYVKRLTEALAKRGDRAAIDSALALGNYKGHTEEKKRLRHGIRAVLLGSFLMKGTALDLKEGIRERLEKLTLDQLKRAFINTFPAFNDQGNRELWSPIHFSDPARLRTTFSAGKNWTGLTVPSYKFICHAIGEGKEGNLLTNPQATMSGWEMISMGVISDMYPYAYARVGLIMKIPKNNIITTSPVDQWFDNYAGSARSTKGNKTDDPTSIVGRSMMASHIAIKNLAIGRMLTPSEIVIFSGNVRSHDYRNAHNDTKHNEIIVCGKAGQPLPHGMTGRIEVIGLFVLVKRDGRPYDKIWYNFTKNAVAGSVPQATLDKYTAASRALRLPLLYLPSR
jgi:hypothetical protein